MQTAEILLVFRESIDETPNKQEYQVQKHQETRPVLNRQVDEWDGCGSLDVSLYYCVG